MCDDVHSFIAEMTAKHIECAAVHEERWGSYVHHAPRRRSRRRVPTETSVAAAQGERTGQGRKEGGEEAREKARAR